MNLTRNKYGRDKGGERWMPLNVHAGEDQVGMLWETISINNYNQRTIENLPKTYCFFNIFEWK